MNVKVYTTPTCPYCAKVKEFLKNNSIKFTEINVAADHNAAVEMIEKSGQMGVPVTDIDGKIIVGYDQASIKKALKLK